MTLGENFERAFAEGKRVLPAPAFSFCLAVACDGIRVGEAGRSAYSDTPEPCDTAKTLSGCRALARACNLPASLPCLLKGT